MKIPEFYRALYSEKEGGRHNISVKRVSFKTLPPNDVVIRVQYSSLNYKDALSVKGLNNVTKAYPHVPGIDAAGIVLQDISDTFEEGVKVIVTGNDLGTNMFGGFGEIIRVPKEWVVVLPENLPLKQSMVFGTAGFTAMYGVERLKREHISPESGPILVTGATGGVGSLSVFFLSQLGYDVIASTRKASKFTFLKELGARKVLHSDEIMNVTSSPLLSRKWAGAIETVGGNLLDTVLRQTQNKGAVACCGNILGKELETNVYPFILRGISLLGIDSAFCDFELRQKIWKGISSIDHTLLPKSFYKTVSLDTLKQEIDLILEGKQVGRVLVKH
ncbi:MAG: YhdH/YhfP family quinone oxidoreductase [Balneolaceae bacterium]